jgi:hypothetical protein
MAEYTPTTTEVRRVYSLAPENLVTGGKPNPNPGYAGAQFDRWLAAVVAAAKAEQRDADLAIVAKHKTEFEKSIARLDKSITDPINTISGVEYDERKKMGQKFAVFALQRVHFALSEAVRGENR